MFSYIDVLCNKKGQATVEAAFLIPVIFVLLLLLLQPTILLYNHMVMQGAASEGCRLLATKSDAGGTSEDAYERYIIRRLGAIPPQDNFHLHGRDCSWSIELEGNERSENVRVTIKNHVRFLPLFDIFGTLFRLYDGSGAFVQEVSVTMPTQPSWVKDSELGLDPRRWVEEAL